MMKSYRISLLWRLPVNKNCAGQLCSTLGDRKGEQNSVPALGEFTAFEKGREKTLFVCLLGISSSIYIV